VFVRLLAAAAVLALTAASARAEWLQATSRHFVVYSDTNAAALRKQATDLERFDAALRYFAAAAGFFYLETDHDAEHNRVTIYVLPHTGAVEKMVGRGDVAGFYIPRVSGSVAFTPRQGDGDGPGALKPRIVLFHEYTHHFLYGGATRMAYPRWFAEGFAEFASTAMERDGGLWLGAAANHRGWGLLTGKGLTVPQLLAPPARMTPTQMDALYGRGWLFTHFLLLNDARRKQLYTYLEAFNAGKPSVEAATEAFGDLRVLETALDRYLNQRNIPALPIGADKLGAPVIDIRPLTPGERALIALRMASTRGVNDRTAPALYARAKAAAAPFKGDAVAQGWLAEMAFDADDLDGAEVAADAALAVDPEQSQALLYKARVLLARADKEKTTDPKRWTAARRWIVKANRANTNDAAALALYYQSFGMAGATPTKAAVAGLFRANDLAPQDRFVAFAAARHHVLDGNLPQAKRLLRALASDPHAGADNPAQRLLAALDAGGAGEAALRAADAATTDAAARN
jgi:hypothetical protein